MVSAVTILKFSLYFYIYVCNAVKIDIHPATKIGGQAQRHGEHRD